jgi:hypothetical protein
LAVRQLKFGKSVRGSTVFVGGGLAGGCATGVAGEPRSDALR